MARVKKKTHDYYTKTYAEKNLLRGSFKQWRLQYLRIRQCKHKTNMALWLWSQAVCRKTLRAWLAYHRLLQAEKMEEIKVLSLRQQQLQREGLVQWLKVGVNNLIQRGY